MPADWFVALDREDPEPRSTLTPPGAPVFCRLRSLSHCRDTVHLANQINLYPHLPNQMKYDFLRHSGALVKHRTTGWARRPREDEADLVLVMDAYDLSRPKARQTLRILKPEQVAELRDWMREGGY